MARLASVLLLLALSSTCLADVRLPTVFSDHMVLQRDQPIAVWGWADADERVTVRFRSASVKTKADAEGRWRVELPPQKAGGPFRLTVRGKNTLRIDDVLVGEVWICSGQSNMEWVVARSLNASEEIAAAKDDEIRHFAVPHRPAGAPLDDVKGAWSVCRQGTVAQFSACGYFMARELRRELGVPVGLIRVTWGGTRIEPWIPRAGFESSSALSAIAEQVAAAHGKKPANQQQPTVLFNGMVNAIVGYSMRGVIWYQGESNLGETHSYTEKMHALITSWRDAWGAGAFPFHYVQIAPFRYGKRPAGLLPQFWEAQAAVLDLVPGTGMVVTNDIATIDDIHPPNKQEVGRRLALLALRRVHGEDVVDTGPTFRTLIAEEGALRVQFDHADGGLASRDGEPLSHFEVAGATGAFAPAVAEIEGDAVVLTSKAVPDPVVMRFAWHKLAEPNLVNGAGLPASAFRAGERPRPDVLPQIEEATGYTLVYDIDLADLGSSPKYAVSPGDSGPGAFDRVAYLLELTSDEGVGHHVWVSMEAFTDDVRLLGIPTGASGARFQQAVKGVSIRSSNERLTGITDVVGNLEFWPGNYGGNNAANVEGASSELWDWGDDATPATEGYGSMQIHVPSRSTTVFAINHWTAGERADIGIGNSALDARCTDWTFAANASSYAHKRLRVFVRTR